MIWPLRHYCNIYLCGLAELAIIHDCIRRLLVSYKAPGKEEAEALFWLLATVGTKIDSAGSKAFVETFFARAMAISENESISSRIRFMLKAVLVMHRQHCSGHIAKYVECRRARATSSE
ncbi:hypothetical protein GGI23_001928 [Coemansia sp. RSA 2559]|nr:hypothetical protein GGI23_001928 [Coemansia sp. RSA 2559]